MLGCTELTCPQHGAENRRRREAAQSLADAGVDFRSSETLRGPEASLMEVSEALRGMSAPLAPARGVMWGLLFAAIFWVPALAFVIGKMP